MYREICDGVEMTLNIDKSYFSSQQGYAAMSGDGIDKYTGNFKFEIVSKYYYEYQKTNMGHTYIRRETIIDTNLANKILNKYDINFSGLLTSGRNEISPVYARGTLSVSQVAYFKSLNRDSILDSILD